MSVTGTTHEAWAELSVESLGSGAFFSSVHLLGGGATQWIGRWGLGFLPIAHLISHL